MRPSPGETAKKAEIRQRRGIVEMLVWAGEAINVSDHGTGSRVMLRLCCASSVGEYTRRGGKMRCDRRREVLHAVPEKVNGSRWDSGSYNSLSAYQ